MESRTATIVLNQPKDVVFSFVSRMENVPRWATEFCRELKRENGATRVVTPHGELFFRIEADAETGVVDFLAGPTHEQLGTFPSRVVALPGNRSAYSFTIFQSPEMDAKGLEEAYRSLQKELGVLEALLS